MDRLNEAARRYGVRLCGGNAEALPLVARSHGLGWRVIGGEDARLLEWARTGQEIRRLWARKRKIETEL